jgi:hypothetical protein
LHRRGIGLALVQGVVGQSNPGLLRLASEQLQFYVERLGTNEDWPPVARTSTSTWLLATSPRWCRGIWRQCYEGGQFGQGEYVELELNFESVGRVTETDNLKLRVSTPSRQSRAQPHPLSQELSTSETPYHFWII